VPEDKKKNLRPPETKTGQTKLRVTPALYATEAAQRIAASPKLQAEFRRAPLQTLVAIATRPPEEPMKPVRRPSPVVPTLLALVALAALGCALALALVDGTSAALGWLEALAFLATMPLAILVVVNVFRD
jgi:hypothetical protein